MKHSKSIIRKAIILALFATLNTVAATNRITVAVVDFAQVETGAEQKELRWLSKAFSDLLINDLGVHKKLRIVTRENMQLLMQEADLRGKSGFTEDKMDPEEFRKMQQYLKVDQIVLGTFSVNNEKIRIRTRVIDHETGDILADFSRIGAFTNALSLEKTIARDMLHYYSDETIPPDAWELPEWTESMSASMFLYDGVDAFDNAQYNTAWYCFRRAAATDPDYADASYWTARMFYYRQDYTHAYLGYKDFINRYPDHPRIGDAVVEYVHSRECGAIDPEEALASLHPEAPGVLPYDRESFTPGKALLFYRALQTNDWGDAVVYNKIDYVSCSPLADWLVKREQQALTYMGCLPEAFALLEKELQITNNISESGRVSGHDESVRLMSQIAMESEDAHGQRLTSEFLNARDYPLTLKNPVAKEDLRELNLKGGVYRRGPNWRILAPPGYSFKKVRTQIFRTNDPLVNSVCRLQIRRYRYVDIDACWTNDKGPNEGKTYEKTIQMPPGCTWFYLRPEYHGEKGADQASFDGWQLTAEFEPIPEDAGGVALEVENIVEYNAYINGIYTRCYNGVIGNLAPGKYQLKIGPLWKNKKWGFEDNEYEIEILPRQIRRMKLTLNLKEYLREAGWNNPAGIASEYPTYKHRPRPNINWQSGAPAIVVHPETGDYTAIWSHLDDLWYADSHDGKKWSMPEALPIPVNSADAEINPRLMIDDQGRYCLLFLSNRGVLRNMGLYISWSRNLKYWSRPVMLEHRSHLDYDITQDDQGRYLLLEIIAKNDDHKSRSGITTLRTSRDFVEWSPPFVWKTVNNSTCLQSIKGDLEENTADAVMAEKARIIQDCFGTYHFIWLNYHVMRLLSKNLMDWSQAEKVPHTTHWSPYNLSVAADDKRLIVAMISSDGSFAGNEMISLRSMPLSEEYGRMTWRTVEFPPAIITGIPSLIYDSRRKQTVLSWQVAEQILHASRISGHVFVMTGTPALRPLQPIKFKSQHINLSKTLDKFVQKLREEGTLPAEDLETIEKTWDKYEKWRHKQDSARKFTDEDLVAHYLNSWKMAMLIPVNHGGWPTRHAFAKRSFNILSHQVEANVDDPELLAAFVCSALFNNKVNDALITFKELKAKDLLWADHAMNNARKIARYYNNTAAAEFLAKAE